MIMSENVMEYQSIRDIQTSARVNAGHGWEAFCLDFVPARISYKVLSCFVVSFVSQPVFIRPYQCERKQVFLRKRENSQPEHHLVFISCTQSYSIQSKVVKSANLSACSRRRRSATLTSSAKIRTHDLDSIIPHTQIFTHLIVFRT